MGHASGSEVCIQHGFVYSRKPRLFSKPTSHASSHAWHRGLRLVSAPRLHLCHTTQRAVHTMSQLARVQCRFSPVHRDSRLAILLPPFFSRFRAASVVTERHTHTHSSEAILRVAQQMQKYLPEITKTLQKHLVVLRFPSSRERRLKGSPTF